ncbi:uncharacterized protein METZ01_LOCUS478426, partial [marine metagenome]
MTGCSNSTSSNDVKNTSWVFVANEGEPCWNEFGDDCSLPGNGSIYMIDDNGNTKQINNVGYIVHSLEVYKDKLYVIVNQEHKLLTYIINSNGITLENTIITNNSNPREMTVVEDMIYFTNWDTQDLKIINTNTNQIEEITIPINGRPEDIIYDGTYIWVSIPEINQYDQNQGTQVAMIDPISNIILEYKEVGRGPVSLELFNNEIYISRTYFDETWSPSYGTSKIG